jgi:hypothetical protein
MESYGKYPDNKILYPNFYLIFLSDSLYKVVQYIKNDTEIVKRICKMSLYIDDTYSGDLYRKINTFYTELYDNNYKNSDNINDDFYDLKNFKKKQLVYNYCRELLNKYDKNSCDKFVEDIKYVDIDETYNSFDILSSYKSEIIEL